MRGWLVPTAQLLGAGWFFAFAILLGIVVGRWADSATGLVPVFTLVGVFLGLAVALVGGIQMLRPFMQRLGNEPPERD